MTTSTAYGVRGLSVELGGRTVLHDVTVESSPGQVVAVVGGDGAGKSTLLRTIVGEVAPARGSVHAPDPSRTGYLPASAGSWAALTVRQNIDFAAGVYGLTGERLEARRGELLDRASLTAAADRPASQLSGGMRRKLGFCMAVVHEPDLLVLDEPTTGVDPVSRVDLWRLVAQTAAQGTAVVMTTTYLDEGERAAALTVLDDGHVLAQGAVDDVLSGLDGTVTSALEPVRPAWAWRRGRTVHELWAPGETPTGEVVRPDLEDVVVALSLRHRAAVAS
ncbi:MAG TPA: ABC transporter ATP-binding protein [Candidatus Nanopelagicales bacterium]|nr:ABC transporter ATP-binding protein [Candidatus Nanopelagicales bacterium]